MHGSTFVWQASRELRISYQQRRVPFIDVDSLLQGFLFLFRHLWEDIGDALRHLDVAATTPTVATTKS